MGIGVKKSKTIGRAALVEGRKRWRNRARLGARKAKIGFCRNEVLVVEYNVEQ
jgi:hypothetical protein